MGLSPSGSLVAGDAFDTLPGFVEITGGELDPLRQARRAEGVAHRCADSVALFVKLPCDGPPGVRWWLRPGARWTCPPSPGGT
jgi:hypothetical protein